MNTKLWGQILAVNITSLMLVLSPLVAEAFPDNSDYPYCCRGNQPGWGRDKYFRQFDRNQTETLTGEVVHLETYSSRRENFSGVHLMVNTKQETIEVHLAPSWYLAEQDFEFSSQDQIVVKGSRIIIDGQPAIIAREIRKGDRVLVLRDANGLPVWRASNR